MWRKGKIEIVPKDLPPFIDYHMEASAQTKGRTYRYFTGKPLYSFGFGLSYTHFQYSNLVNNAKPSAIEDLVVSADIQNAGDREGDEVVQMYVKVPSGNPTQPLRSLKAFSRIHLQAGEKKTVSFTITPTQLSSVLASGKKSLLPGAYSFSVGGQQPDNFSQAKENVLLGSFEVSAE
jgi:beta-glucosidase